MFSRKLCDLENIENRKKITTVFCEGEIRKLYKYFFCLNKRSNSVSEFSLRITGRYRVWVKEFMTFSVVNVQNHGLKHATV